MYTKKGLPCDLQKSVNPNSTRHANTMLAILLLVDMSTVPTRHRHKASSPSPRALCMPGLYKVHSQWRRPQGDTYAESPRERVMPILTMSLISLLPWITFRLYLILTLNSNSSKAQGMFTFNPYCEVFTGPKAS